MNLGRLVTANLKYHRKSNWGVLIGTALATAVIIGALGVGDTIRHSLALHAQMQWGQAEFALITGDQTFRTQLADELQAALPVAIAPILSLPGMAIADGGNTRANAVQVLGVDERFWAMALTPSPVKLGPFEAGVNRRLAHQLRLKPGDDFLVRTGTPPAVHRDLAFADRNQAAPLRVRIKAIIDDEGFGRFSQKNHQVAPYNVFLNLGYLAQEVNAEGRSNILLASGREGNRIAEDVMNRRLAECWSLQDINYRLVEHPAVNKVELRTEGIFIPQSVADRAFASGTGGQGVFSYFVNAISHHGVEVPYSIVSAPGSPLVPDDLGDDEIILNQWLARELQASVGSDVSLRYYAMGPLRKLMEVDKVFRVRGILAIAGGAADPTLMPDIPGLSSVDNCRDWNPGIPVELRKIRERDEAYWRKHKGTPKAFVSLTSAQAMWSNEFGDYTGIRYPSEVNTPHGLETAIQNQLSPASFGLEFRRIRNDTAGSANPSVDFSQLFLGLSMFLIASALLLTSLLFGLGMEQRQSEIGTLLALGFAPRTIQRLFLLEGTSITAVGGALGVLAGLGYAKVVLAGLSSIWQGAIGVTTLYFQIEPISIAGGWFAGYAAAMLTIGLVIRRKAYLQPHKLQNNQRRVRGRRDATLVMALVFGVLAVVLIVAGLRRADAGIQFFLAGTALLLGSITGCHWILSVLTRLRDDKLPGLPGIALKGVTRNPGRSLAVISLLACGVFMVAAVGANRKGMMEEPWKRASGTGGFLLFAETTLPLHHRLDEPSVRRELGLDGNAFAEMRFVQMRVNEGDDASCLNLNRVVKPRLLGVSPEELAMREAFSFHTIVDGGDRENPWRMLEQDWNGAVPAIADYNTILWILGHTVGDELLYPDEVGHLFKIKLVGAVHNSILQGSLLIPEESFRRYFPSLAGTRLLLMDQVKPGPIQSDAINDLSGVFANALRDLGTTAMPTAVRLQDFGRVADTYLLIFLMLGGLGLALGTAGLGVVLYRNTMERQGEYGMLRAVGFQRSQISTIIWMENAVLIMAGLMMGALAASVLPTLARAGLGDGFWGLITLILSMAVLGFASIGVGAKASMRGDPITSLRVE